MPLITWTDDGDGTSRSDAPYGKHVLVLGVTTAFDAGSKDISYNVHYVQAGEP